MTDSAFQTVAACSANVRARPAASSLDCGFHVAGNPGGAGHPRRTASVPTISVSRYCVVCPDRERKSRSAVVLLIETGRDERTTSARLDSNERPPL